MIDTLMYSRTVSSAKIIESQHALVPPKPARSDDMRCMVEDLERFGQVRLKPGAFALPDGSMVLHPTLAADVRQQLQVRAARLRENLMMDLAFGRSFR